MTNYDPQAIYQSAEYQQELAAQRSFMSRVYGWMTIGLLITALTSLFIANDPVLIKSIFQTGLFWVLIIAEFGIVLLLSAALRKLPVAVAAGLFLLYSALTGATLSIILLIYTASSVGGTFIVTAGMFGTMSLFGYVTKKNLSGFGHFLMMGLIGLVIAMLVNLFLRSDAMGWFISFIGVVVFTGLTAYDTQKIKQMYAVDAPGSAMVQKTALYGAFALYLDFINLFLFLLRFMGNRRN
jgi:FtsH-binding integral membrane protein